MMRVVPTNLGARGVAPSTPERTGRPGVRSPNALEVMTLKARYSLALSALCVAAGAPLASVEAQNRTADPNAPRLMVGVFRAADKNAGVQAADAIRERITRDVPVKQLWVVPKQDVVAVLEASGFPTN